MHETAIRCTPLHIASQEWVDVKGTYVEKGYVSNESTTVPGLPFLIAVLVALFATLGYVVAATS